MLSAHSLLAAGTSSSAASILCTLLLLAGVILAVIGLVDVLGKRGAGRAAGRERGYTALVAGAVCLVIYLVAC